MKKIFYIMLTMILSLTFVSCDRHRDVCLILNQVNTTWVSENPDIFFTMTENNDCYGILKTSEKNYNISMEFGYGFDSGVNIIDYDVLKKNNFVRDIYNDIILRADCKFSEDKFTSTVTDSFIDSIKAGEKITFNRVEELPDWASETVETYDAS